METLIHKLNLPQLENCIVNGAEEKFFQPTGIAYYKKVKSWELFKEPYLFINGLIWHNALIFYRPEGSIGHPHKDSTVPGVTTWAINWIYKGNGLMEYWELEDFENVVSYKDSKGYSTIKCTNPKIPSRLKYFLDPGAYLVNTTYPHYATGFGNRYCISYRSLNLKKNWNEIVELFRNLIIEQPVTRLDNNSR